MRISKLKAYMLIKNSEGRIFTATFIKKDGEVRTMNCRLGVKKYLTGKGMSYNPELREMIPVFDIKQDEYRMLNLSTLQELKLDGKTYQVGNYVAPKQAKPKRIKVYSFYYK